MKVGIYNQPSGGAVGGSEFCVAVLASALTEQHQVEILHHRLGLNAERLRAQFAVNLEKVGFRPITFAGQGRPAENGLRAYRRERREHFDVTKDYDVFIAFTHDIPPFCAAKQGILVTLFPIEHERNLPLRGSRIAFRPAAMRQALKYSWTEWKRESRLQSYHLVLSISGFTKQWTKKRWGIDSEVLFPPVEAKFSRRAKSKSIISVGRFAVGGHRKNQLEMVRAFKGLSISPSIDSWTYNCVGACGSSEKERQYLSAVQDEATGSPVRILSNIERSHLRRLYEEAQIFWHAAGLDVDEETAPELAEHFGIATVEAMAAGCVPVVANKGAQPELILHGINGFLWNSLRELTDYTSLLMNDPPRLRRMSEAARERATLFGCDEFTRRFCSLAGIEL